MRRTIIGLLFILHGIAHSALGMWASSFGPAWLVTPLWWIAQVGFVAAGLGLVGVDGLRRIWAPLALAAGLSSLVLFGLYGHISLMLGLVADALVITLGLQWGEPTALERLRGQAPVPDAHQRRHAALTVVSGLALLYMSGVILVRPWQLTLGTTAVQRMPSLLGSLVAPADVFLLEPAHFIMERGVLRGIRRRTERSMS